MTAADGTSALPGRFAGRGWFAAVMLLVLLTAAGLPGPGAGLAARQRVEANHEAQAPRPARAVAGEVIAAERLVRAADVQLPRPLPRTRSVQARGLPPSRAPTV